MRSARLAERRASLQADLNGLGRRMADLAIEGGGRGGPPSSRRRPSAAEAALQAAASALDEAAEAERERAGELAGAEAAAASWQRCRPTRVAAPHRECGGSSPCPARTPSPTPAA